jgi:hypothetical protein
VDLRAGLDDLEKRKFFTLTGFELRPLSHPACSYSLYSLLYPDSSEKDNNHNLMGSIHEITDNVQRLFSFSVAITIIKMLIL